MIQPSHLPRVVIVLNLYELQQNVRWLDHHDYVGESDLIYLKHTLLTCLIFFFFCVTWKLEPTQVPSHVLLIL